MHEKLTVVLSALKASSPGGLLRAFSKARRILPVVGTFIVCTITPVFDNSTMSIFVALVSSAALPVARKATIFPGANVAARTSARYVSELNTTEFEKTGSAEDRVRHGWRLHKEDECKKKIGSFALLDGASRRAEFGYLRSVRTIQRRGPYLA